ncbi:MAG: diguanylate cyclase [Rhodocyclaceae bacterium]|nr:diguanylate cyclase [Rhodocyclaceae bacterium]
MARPLAQGAGVTPHPLAGWRVTLGLLLTLFAAISTAWAEPEPTARIAVLAYRPKLETQRRWQPLAVYLEQSVPGWRFEINALSLPELEEAIARRQVDFVFTNPGHYVLMTYRNGLSSPLATMVERADGRNLAAFGGVIFTQISRKDIATLADLKGKTLAAAAKNSLGGYQIQAHELAHLGITLPADADLIETGMPQDRVIEAVLSGRADVGFVRTGVIEDLAREGRLDPARLKILNRQKLADFPFVVSTHLYPEWPFAVMPSIDEELARRTAAALLAMPHDSAMTTSIGIHGFTVPSDYRSVETLLRELRVPPFDKMPSFTRQDVWTRYRLEIAGSLLAGGLITILAAFLIVANRRLSQARSIYRDVMAAQPTGVYRLNVSGRGRWPRLFWRARGGRRYRFEAINDRFCEILGVSREQLYTDAGLFRKRVHPEDLAEFSRHNREARENRTAFNWEGRLLHEGHSRWVHLESLPRRADNGDLVWTGVLYDISERKAVEAELQRLATTDSLTGLANRHHFLAQTSLEMARVKRFGDPAALLMLDLDHFKLVNDTYGHATGDTVLKAFAATLRGSLRQIDLAGRLGGEEFGVLLPGTSTESARQFAERLRENVAAMDVQGWGKTIPVKVSIGVARIAADDATPDNVLARADSALYRAKSLGRNRVEVAT